MKAGHQSYKIGFLQNVYINIIIQDNARVQTLRFEKTLDFKCNANIQVDCSLRSEFGIQDG